MKPSLSSLPTDFCRLCQTTPSRAFLIRRTASSPFTNSPPVRTLTTTTSRRADTSKPPYWTQSRAQQQSPEYPHNSVTNRQPSTPSITSHGIAGSLVDQIMNPDRLKDSPPKKLQHQGTPSAAITVLDSTSRQLKAREIEIERLSMRRWQPGDVFAPHDLSPIESRKWKQRKRPSRDVFDVLGLKIEDVWKNPIILQEYMTSMGKIKHSKVTGLRPVNQRKIAKAIRRAIGMGFYPSVHAHPEMLRRRGSYEWK